MSKRYHRINIDGLSTYKTETRVAAIALLAGTFAVINSEDKFEQAKGDTGRIYIVDAAYHQGLTIKNSTPAGCSAVGNYVEEGREFAVRVKAGQYKKDQPIKVGEDGWAAIAASDGEAIGYCQDEAVVTADDKYDFIRIRIRRGVQSSANPVQDNSGNKGGKKDENAAT